MNTGTLTGMTKQKRGYSREFTPKTERRVRFEIDRIPPTLYEAVQVKAKREGVSLRALTLRLWKEWAARPTGEEPRDEREAVECCADVILHDVRRAEAKKNAETGPPPNFGKFDNDG